MSTPTLTIISGLPGAGKTTLAERLAQERHAVRLCPDDWLQALGLNIRDDVMRDRVESLQRALMADVLSAGASVICEWGTWEASVRTDLRSLAHSLGARAELIILDPPLETLLERVRERAADGGPKISEEQLRSWDGEFERADDEETAAFDDFVLQH